MRVPDFIYVGGSKCGSSWLFEIARDHPDVFVPVAKDIKYFDQHSREPLSWYLGFFEGAGRATAAGEFSHDYFLSEEIAHRIHRHFPHVKIICSLREPASRTLSRWLYARTTDISGEVSFGDYARQPHIVRENEYLRNLKPYFELFPRQQLHAIYYDELAADPAGVAADFYRFLGVDTAFVSKWLHRRVLPAREARSPTLGRIAYSVARWLRQVGGTSIVGSVKRDGRFDRLLYKPLREKPPVPSADLDWIRDRFSPDYRQLGEMIGRPVPAAWTRALPAGD